MNKDLSTELLKFIRSQLGRMREGVVVLWNDYCCQASSAFVPNSWFNFLFQHLRTVIAIYKSLIFEEIAVKWILWVPRDGQHNQLTFVEPLLKRSSHLLTFTRIRLFRDSNNMEESISFGCTPSTTKNRMINAALLTCNLLLCWYEMIE